MWSYDKQKQKIKKAAILNKSVILNFDFFLFYKIMPIRQKTEKNKNRRKLGSFNFFHSYQKKLRFAFGKFCPNFHYLE
jgi:hypothetical protein